MPVFLRQAAICVFLLGIGMAYGEMMRSDGVMHFVMKVNRKDSPVRTTVATTTIPPTTPIPACQTCATPVLTCYDCERFVVDESIVNGCKVLTCSNATLNLVVHNNVTKVDHHYGLTGKLNCNTNGQYVTADNELVGERWVGCVKWPATTTVKTTTPEPTTTKIPTCHTCTTPILSCHDCVSFVVDESIIDGCKRLSCKDSTLNLVVHNNVSEVDNHYGLTGKLNCNANGQYVTPDNELIGSRWVGCVKWPATVKTTTPVPTTTPIPACHTCTTPILSCQNCVSFMVDESIVDGCKRLSCKDSTLNLVVHNNVTEQNSHYGLAGKLNCNENAKYVTSDNVLVADRWVGCVKW